MTAHSATIDVCIVGAGPAGLNAALVLGRCGRSVVVYDSGQPRNAASQGLRCFLSRDGINPHELRAIGRLEVGAYPSVTFIDAQVVAAKRSPYGFELVTSDGQSRACRILLLATGRVDVLPDRPGFRELYGRGVHHCPYCDGWEHRGQRIVAYGEYPAVADLALALLTWTPRVTVVVPEPGQASADDRRRLGEQRIEVAPADIASVEGTPEGGVTGAQLANGERIACDAVFFTSALPQRSALAENLGCEMDDGGSVVCRAHAATGVPGLYVAGNVRGGVHLAIMAAAEGAEAAIAINEELADNGLNPTEAVRPRQPTSGGDA
ncbi:NAD(P)/FAD-dependent oxidoreductase [Opitutus sp. ER46]|uniref:NAD(P)/FAD-dependent oxidoreductase n=1 Tax=Opitutus sp. ER46 TaxID=2161864 RepID=UPI001304D12C|nr:NAD(P)/FAD-dependent oxidoreductase [Opitutus sp. ER46]